MVQKLTETQEREFLHMVTDTQIRLNAPRHFSTNAGQEIWETDLSPIFHQISSDQYTLPLNGNWQVSRWPFPDEATLVHPATNDSHWKSLPQPGKIFSQNPHIPPDSIPGYDRVGMSHLDPEDGAVIRRRIRIPSDWLGKEIFLRFDGIYPAGRIYLNGTLLGSHASGLTPAGFPVTHLVTPGEEALVAVRLLRRHPFINLDMPRHSAEFCGLSQDALFFATEHCRIENFRLPALLNEDLSIGEIRGEAILRNDSPTDVVGSLCLELSAPCSEASLPQPLLVSCPIRIPAGESANCPLSLTVEHPLLWNDEFPHLYTMRLVLSLPGLPDQEICHKVGFRRLEFRQGRPFLNGNPVKFRGVNHLTFHPVTGLYTPADWLRQNLLLMKKANINCIRTHYLGPRCLGDLCDEMGIYLVQELPVDWGTHYIHDPAWIGPALTRLHAGVLRDRHHPSLMVWSVGNENMPESLEVAERGYLHLRLFHHFVKTLDDTRPTMFPPPGPANAIEGIFEVRVGDIADTHYSFRLAKSFLETGVVKNPRAWTCEFEETTREQALQNGWNGSWFSSEYGLIDMEPDILSAPYGSIIADCPADPESLLPTAQVFSERLKQEWGFLRSEPTCLGGAYFPWICSSSPAGESAAFCWALLAEDHNWGVMTPDLLPKPEFWALRSLFSPVWFPQEIQWEGGDTICFPLENQYNAINLSQCVFRTMMDWGTGANTRKWKDIPVECPPGSTTTMTIPLWNPRSLESLREGRITLCRVALLDASGFRVTTADIRILPQSGKQISSTEGKPLAIGPDAVIE